MAGAMTRYDPAKIEPKWQAFWEKDDTFRTPEGTDRPKTYILDMFPYPSGSGLHVGHPEGYTATDIMARYRRATGCDVLHPHKVRLHQTNGLAANSGQRDCCRLNR